MKLVISKNYILESIIFSLLILRTLFNNSKYGTIIAQVFILLLLFMALTVIKKDVLNRSKKNIFYGFLWCSTFLIGLIMFNNSVYMENQTFIYICILIFFTCLFLGVNFSMEQIQILLTVYLVSVLIVSINIIGNYVNRNFYVDMRASFQIWGVYKDPNYVASLIIPAVFMVTWTFFNVHKILRKGILLAADVILVAAILITGSRAPLVAIVVAVGVYAVLQLFDSAIRGIYKVIIIIAVIVSAVFVSAVLLSVTNRFTDISGYVSDIRLIIWADALEFWKRSPVIGNGVSSTSNYTLSCWYGRAAHNCFIDLLGDSGVIGVFCLAGILRKIIQSSPNKKMILTYVVICMVPQSFINGFYTFNFWFAICLIKLYSDYDKNKMILNIS